MQVDVPVLSGSQWSASPLITLSFLPLRQCLWMNLELTVLVAISGCATTPNPNGSFVSEMSIILSWAAVAHRLARMAAIKPQRPSRLCAHAWVQAHAELFPEHEPQNSSLRLAQQALVAAAPSPEKL